MKAIILLVSLVTFLSCVSAQSNVKQSVAVKNVGTPKEVNIKKTSSVKADKPVQMNLYKEIPVRKSKPVVAKKNVNRSVKKPIRSNARVSDYMSLEKEIIKRTVSGSIPNSLPKHIEGQTKEEYQLILKAWAKENIHLIKKEFHSEIINE